jgi:hypothetical protein
MPDMRSVNDWKNVARVLAASAVVWTCLPGHAGAQPIASRKECRYGGEVDLKQNWTRAQREAFWFSPQGSRIMPYSWFLALEQESSEELVIEPCFMESLGFIPVPGKELPIGFARDGNSARSAGYIGLTCAACHTSRLNIGGKWAIVEGGPALVDFSRFLDVLVASISDTLRNEMKFARWVKRVNDTSQTGEQLKQGLALREKELKARQVQNAPEVPYGYGRVDAFGHIFNRVFATGIEADGNARTPDAPVSYPFLWDTPRGMHDQVQWNWSAPNKPLLGLLPGDLFRNLGELLGVFGTYDLTTADTCTIFRLPCYKTSSYQRVKLERLENLVKMLYSPVWPSHLPGMSIDRRLAEAGKSVYKNACADCHRLIEPARNHPGRNAGDRLVPLASDPARADRLPLDTDSKMTDNFNARLFEQQLETGILKGRPVGLKSPGGKFGEVTTGDLILNHVVAGVFLGKGRHDERTREPEAVVKAPTKGYKARSLNGIWATAPYLHNGSVPNLRTLLEADRGAGFWVGSDTFDAVDVGLSTGRGPRSFWFDPTKDGNRNTGHPYGVDLAPEEKQALLEYLKTL